MASRQYAVAQLISRASWIAMLAKNVPENALSVIVPMCSCESGKTTPEGACWNCAMALAKELNEKQADTIAFRNGILRRQREGRNHFGVRFVPERKAGNGKHKYTGRWIPKRWRWLTLREQSETPRFDTIKAARREASRRNREKPVSP